MGLSKVHHIDSDVLIIFQGRVRVVGRGESLRAWDDGCTLEQEGAFG